MFEKIEKDFDDFCKAADRFIKKQKKIHEACICERCGMVIEPDQQIIEVKGIPYHLDCFKETIK